MVLDFSSFMRQRNPRLQFGAGDFGVNELVPQTGMGPQGGRLQNWGQVPQRVESPWQMAPASGDMDFQQQAPPPVTAPAPTIAPPAPQAATGLGQSGQQQVANAGVQGTIPQGGQDPKWSALAAGMLRNGWGLDPQGARQNNGIVVGYGSPYQTTIIMPTDYSYGQDTARWDVAGAGTENAMQRALRKTFDELSFNSALNPMQVLAKWMRFVDQEARQQGASSGFNMGQMGGQGMDPTAGKPTSAAPSAAPGTTPGTQPGAAPGAGGGGGGAGGAGAAGTSDDAREFLMDDPRAAFRELMRRRGYGNLDSGGYAAQFLQSRYEPALQALAQVASGMGGEDAIANETFDSFLNSLRGGSLSRFARDTARQAYGDSGIYRADAGDEANQAYYENLNYLNSLGSGGLVQRSEKNRLDRFMNQYGDIVYRTLQGETGLPQTFEEFMRQNGYSIFR